MSRLVISSSLSANEARRLVDRIHEGLDDVRVLILEFYEQRGWFALGYTSWRKCVVAEFGQSQARVYQLMTAAKIDRDLSTIVETPISVPESHARELSRLKEPEDVREVYEEVRAFLGAALTARDLRQAVDLRLTSPAKPFAFASPAPHSPVLEHLDSARKKLIQARDSGSTGDMGMRITTLIVAIEEVEERITPPAECSEETTPPFDQYERARQCNTAFIAHLRAANAELKTAAALVPDSPYSRNIAFKIEGIDEVIRNFGQATGMIGLNKRRNSR